MKITVKSFFWVIILLAYQLSLGQDRMITGKVIDQNLKEFPGVILMTLDSKIIDTTDWNGNFQFKYTEDLKNIKLTFLATQTEEFEIIPDCNHYETILLNEWIYDFISLKRANRKKERERRQLLPKLYREAEKKGIFKNEPNCN